MKKTRKIKTFVPEPDVAPMLERAQQHGLVLGEIMNAALRECGPKVIKSLAAKRLKKANEAIHALSFKYPDRQPDRELMAA